MKVQGCQKSSPPPLEVDLVFFLAKICHFFRWFAKICQFSLVAFAMDWRGGGGLFFWLLKDRPYIEGGVPNTHRLDRHLPKTQQVSQCVATHPRLSAATHGQQRVVLAAPPAPWLGGMPHRDRRSVLPGPQPRRHPARDLFRPALGWACPGGVGVPTLACEEFTRLAPNQHPQGFLKKIFQSPTFYFIYNCFLFYY